MGLRDKAKNAKIVEDKNTYLSEPQKGLELCANIISLGEMRFKNTLERIDDILNQFISITRDNNNEEGVSTYSNLILLKDELVNILNFPKLENHYTVAVGGGFSSGKSTFLNQVLGLENILPTDTNPTTSISSYITSGGEDKFFGLNNFNNIINLDREAIQAISHAFNKKYSLSFSHILKLIMIEQKDFKYKNLVFLDTPGYSKSDSMDRVNNTDENVAREHLKTTDFLIWLVDCQTPISSSDMQFIKTLELEHPVLVVLNKADKKTLKDIDALVAKTKENLISQEIPFFDVIGYSSSKDIEFSSSQNVIKTYLDKVANATTGTKIIKRADEIFKLYIDYFDSRLVEYRTTRKILNEMILKDAIDEEFLDEITALSGKRVKQIKHIENAKKKISGLGKELNEVIVELLKESNINIVESNKVQIFEKDLYEKLKSKVSAEVLRFQASLQLKEQKELLKYKDLNNIQAKVYKISSIGVFIKIVGIEGDLLISKSKILHTSGGSRINDIFKIDDSVIVQITADKKCIVIK